MKQCRRALALYAAKLLVLVVLLLVHTRAQAGILRTWGDDQSPLHPYMAVSGREVGNGFEGERRIVGGTREEEQDVIRWQALFTVSSKLSSAFAQHTRDCRAMRVAHASVTPIEGLHIVEEKAESPLFPRVFASAG